MTRELYQKKLRELQDGVLIMGSMVEKALQRSVAHGLTFVRVGPRHFLGHGKYVG